VTLIFNKSQEEYIIVNITEEERRKYKLPNNRAQTILFFADLYSWYLFEENRNLMIPIAGSEVQQHTARYAGTPASQEKQKFDYINFRL
jgi:hypothetical protein